MLPSLSLARACYCAKQTFINCGASAATCVYFQHVCWHSYYPTVGLHSTGEEVRLNFGADPAQPFEFNLEGMLREERDKQLATVTQVLLGLADVNPILDAPWVRLEF